MKTLLAVAIGCCTLMIANVALAGCGSCYSCGSSVTCKPDVPNACECTDPGRGRNPCMSDSKYCKVFGNIGGGSDNMYAR